MACALIALSATVMPTQASTPLVYLRSISSGYIYRTASQALCRDIVAKVPASQRNAAIGCRHRIHTVRKLYFDQVVGWSWGEHVAVDEGPFGVVKVTSLIHYRYNGRALVVEWQRQGAASKPLFEVRNQVCTWRNVFQDGLQLGAEHGCTYTVAFGATFMGIKLESTGSRWVKGAVRVDGSAAGMWAG